MNLVIVNLSKLRGFILLWLYLLADVQTVVSMLTQSSGFPGKCANS